MRYLRPVRTGETVITPADIERRLLQLGKEIDQAHDDLAKAEHDYHTAKADLEISLARARLSLEGGTVQDRADKALTACAGAHSALAVAEAVVKAARANAARLRVQVDIARSVGTSVRTSMEVQ